jgi:hypothetical protein
MKNMVLTLLILSCFFIAMFILARVVSGMIAAIFTHVLMMK